MLGRYSRKLLLQSFVHLKQAINTELSAAKWILVSPECHMKLWHLWWTRWWAPGHIPLCWKLSSALALSWAPSWSHPAGFWEHKMVEHSQEVSATRKELWGREVWEGPALGWTLVRLQKQPGDGCWFSFRDIDLIFPCKDAGVSSAETEAYIWTVQMKCWTCG